MDFDFVSTDGKTALFVAVSRCNQMALDALLTLPKGKVNLNIKLTLQSFEEVNPLMLAAEKGCLKSFQKLVVLDDIVLDIKNKRGASLKDVISYSKFSHHSHSGSHHPYGMYLLQCVLCVLTNYDGL